MKCYEKDGQFASCKKECQPGISADDPSELQTPWTCTLLAKGADSQNADNGSDIDHAFSTEPSLIVGMTILAWTFIAGL